MTSEARYDMTTSDLERPLYQMPVEGNECEQWKARMWNQMFVQFKGYPGLAPLEQWTRLSHREQRCVECGAAGTVRQESFLIKSVSHYYFCGECAEYWERKAQ